MSELYKRIEELCQSANINITDMCRKTGVNRGNLTDLKMGRQSGLSAKNADKIASYFGVSVSYLLGTESTKEKAPALTKKDERDIAKDLEELKASLENNETLMFDGDPMTPEARESILAAMKLGLEAAKVKNKEKYTPKKYKGG